MNATCTRIFPWRPFYIFALATTATTPSLNVMTDFIHTWSKLNAHETCPRQFEYRYVLGNFEPMGEQAKWGDVVHNAMEQRILGRELAPLPDSMKPYQKYLDAALIAKERGLEVVPEWKVAIRRDGTPCDYWAKDAWVRGKVDLSIIGGATVFSSDYKTGKWKGETGQMAMDSWMILAHRPTAKVVHTRYLWMQGGDQLKRTYVREPQGIKDEIPLQRVDATFRQRIAKVENDLATGHFDPTPNGLCKKYCNVLSCEYNGKR